MEDSKISEFIEEFLFAKEIEEGCASSTIKAYRYDLQKFINIIGDISVNSPFLRQKIRLFLKKLKEKKYSKVYSCGPEIMAKAVFDLCEKHKINCEISLERYMRCGFGVCGACACSDKLVCKDGPVFNSKELRNMQDFGSSALLKSGKKVPLNEYFSWRQKC